jgi:predicted outer membrane repeat protein
MKPRRWLQGLFSSRLPQATGGKRKRSQLTLEALESRELLASHGVDSILDVSDGDYSAGNFTLREAIEQANANPGADTITFDTAGVFSTPQTIVLTGGELVIAGDLTITAPGADRLTVDADGGSRVFNVFDGDLADNVVVIDGLTITGGNTTGNGGGILNRDENLTILNSVLSDNSAARGGGLENQTGTLTVRNSIITGNSANYDGGGLSDSGGYGSVVQNSVISDNSANHGGGVRASGGILTVENSTISGNSATTEGGGIYADAGTLTLESSTISGNSATKGAGLYNYSSLQVRNSTITGNVASSSGGGLYNYFEQVAVLQNSLIVGNSAPTGGEIFNRGQVNADSYNLFGHSGLSNARAFRNFAPGSTDITTTSDGTQPTALTSILDTTLADNGGSTLTHALLAGSPAVNAGDPTAVAGENEVPEFDQRGDPFVRQVGPIDIGAFEVQSLSLVVDTTVDESDGVYSAGDLSLREAVFLANFDADASTITFDGSLSGGTMTLTDGEIAITEALTIAGLGADRLTISGGGASRIFTIESGVTAEMSGLTLTGGSSSGHAGAIYNNGTLAVTDSTLDSNSAAFFGGAIFNRGTLTVVASTLSGNTATYGGAIYSDGTLTLTNSTLSGNAADVDGGAVQNTDGPTILRNVTVTGNRADADGNLSGEGGGIWTFGDSVTTTTLYNSIVAGNFKGTGTLLDDLANKRAEPASAGNIVSEDSGNELPDGNDNQVVADVSTVIDTTLADNGGPTRTHALAIGSPAIDAGVDPLGLEVDQRGEPFVRQFGPIDIGAFEAQSLGLLVDTTVDDSDGDYSVGDLSFREAIELSNANPGADTISFDTAGLFQTPQTIVLTGGELAITDDLTIAGPGAANLTIDGNGSRIFNIDDGNDSNPSQVTLSDLTVNSSDPIPTSAGIVSRESLTISDTTITGIRSGIDTLPGRGGAIDAYLPSLAALVIQDSTISDNRGDFGGGGILVTAESDSTTMIHNSDITGNGDENNEGGGVSVSGGGDLTITGSNISNNHGRAVRKRGSGSLMVVGSTVSGNSGFNGSAITNSGGEMSIIDTTVDSNVTSNRGAITHSNGTGTITNSTITGNRSYRGGGIDLANASLTITGSTISWNRSTIGGGGVHQVNGVLTIANSTISGNYGDPNGGGIYQTGGTTTITNSTISGNFAEYYGGGAFLKAGVLTIAHSTVAGNRTDSAYEGGGIFNAGGTFTLNHSIVGDNQSSRRSPDISGLVSATYSLIENTSGATITDGGGVLTGVDPMLEPLADNGGPTRTHALLPGSPALNAGDPAAVAGVGGVPAFDQRGEGYPRVLGRIDIGAYESVTELVVDSISDVSDGDYTVGNLSLREAIELSNATGGANTITFDTAGVFSTPQTIVLTGGQLRITDDLTITGTGAANLTIDGNNSSRIFNINDATAAQVPVVIDGLTVTGGRTGSGTGGGILNHENLTLQNSVVSGNVTKLGGRGGNGGGIWSSGTLVISNSDITGNDGYYGGGIWNSGSLTISGGTVSDNASFDYGGGIWSGHNATATITGSTITGNVSDLAGGGVYTDGEIRIENSTISDNIGDSGGVGGGFLSGSRAIAIINNSTVSGNKAAFGAGLANRGTLEITNSTITGNTGESVGGILSSRGTVSLSNTIVAGNTATLPFGTNHPDIRGTIDSNSHHNLIGDGTGMTGISDGVNGNQVGTAASPIDPLLAPLADNDGPTMTHALLPGSPAINAGDPSALAGVGTVPEFDQRGTGFSRVNGARIDIGAVESPNQLPSIASQTFHLDENLTFVGAVFATDPDSPADVLTFSIVGTGDDDTSFSITAGGDLSFITAPDFENPKDAGENASDNVYRVAVQVQDTDGATASATIDVVVDPVNDNAPVFTSAATASVAENSTAVQTLSATDADLPGQSVTFSITGDGADDAQFHLIGGNQLAFVAAPNFEAPADANEDNVYEVEIEADDGNGLTTRQTVHVTVTNINPSTPTDSNAAVNTVAEGAASGTAVGITATATDPLGPAVMYSLLDDSAGAFAINSVTGVVTVADGSVLDGDEMRTITVQASDGAGGTSQATFTIAVTNVAPVIDSLASSATFADKALPGQTVTVTGFFSDAGVPDTHLVKVVWDDGTVTENLGPDLQIDQDNNTFTATHVYSTGGLFTITVTLTDDDGATDIQTTTAVVTGARLTDDGELQIVGTNGVDSVSVKYHREMGDLTGVEVETQLAGQQKVDHTFEVAAVNRIVVYACDGDDVVTIQDQVDIDAFINGGAGNDHLTGGGGNDEILGGPGNDIVIGGSGDDLLDGGEGRNLLIGGIGADVLTGGTEGDLLIGGFTAFDKDPLALDLLLAEWTSERSYLERIDNIREGKGPILKGSKVALVASGSKQTVFDDGEQDVLTGGDGLDWFFASLADDLTDKQGDEFWDVL